jgi:hypothetical protein
MKVAMIAPIAWPTPPEHYGPWESIASLLTEGLVARGVDVTLFATLNSVTAAALDGVCPRGYAEDAQLDGRVWEVLHVSHALARSGEFELVHNHLDWLPLAFDEHVRAPMVTTIHGFSGAGILPAYRRSRSAFVAISDSDRDARLDYVVTIHHGIDLQVLPFRARSGDQRRGPGHISGLGRPAARAEVLGEAATPLHPMHFDEPFGLSVVEALACGTPVLAYKRGSMAELVDEGVTGYLAHDIESSVGACGGSAGPRGCSCTRGGAVRRRPDGRGLSPHLRRAAQVSQHLAGGA